MSLTPEQREVGRDNYYEAIGVSRRDFLKGVIAAGAVSGAGLGAMYFGYSKVTNPVRVGVIGTGDEGSVLIGAINPEYVQVTAIADIRPYNVHRAFHGDWASPAALAARKGLMAVYGWKSEDEARKHVKVYDASNGGYPAMLKDPDIEAVIIALPLHLHAPAACAAMLAGKHVLTEKLMAHNVAQCKVMGRLAEELGLYLAVGHQRHYSILYDNAVNLLRWGLLGQLNHIRAQWHRGNLPGRDSWQQPLPGGEVVFGGGKSVDRILRELRSKEQELKTEKDPARAELLARQVAQWRAWNADRDIKAEDFGYISTTLPNGRPRPAMEELCRWRLWERTGGGLMAELGSHQLDAAGIFVSALRADGKKAHPLSVHTVGGRSLFPLDRDAEDHVCCLFEFPAPSYDPSFDVGYRDATLNFPNPEKGIPGYEDGAKDNRIVVMYSTLNGNGYGGYGEVIMGTKGTLVLEREQELMVYKDADTASRVAVKNGKGGPTMDTQASGDAGPAAKAAEGTGPVSRGYTEQIEHWAWCIRNKAPENQPRCKPSVALGDAVIALGTNVAVAKRKRGEPGFLQFDEAWYDLHNDATPDGSSCEKERSALTAQA